MNDNVGGLVQVFGISSALATEILQSCAEPAVWKYQLFNSAVFELIEFSCNFAAYNKLLLFGIRDKGPINPIGFPAPFGPTLLDYVCMKLVI